MIICKVTNWVIILLCAVAGSHGNYPSHNKNDPPRYKMVMSDDDDMKKGDNSGDICYFLDDAIPTKVLTFGERPVCVEPEEEKYVQELLTSAVSRQNFAWKLVRHFFMDSELKDHNCFGRRGKSPLNIQKLEKVENIVFAYYPVVDVALYAQAWRECIVAIDKGIRNSFSDYGYIKAGERSSLCSFQFPRPNMNDT